MAIRGNRTRGTGRDEREGRGGEDAKAAGGCRLEDGRSSATGAMSSLYIRTDTHTPHTHRQTAAGLSGWRSAKG